MAPDVMHPNITDLQNIVAAKASEPTSHTVVIGLGNPYLSDEGIGCCLVTILTERYRQARAKVKSPSPPQSPVSFRDLGTGGINVLHSIAGRKRVIFLDCAFMNFEPGTIHKFFPFEVGSNKKLTHFSLHEGDLLQTLALARKLGECPEEIIIFGIEPADLSPGNSLSTPLISKLEEYIAIIESQYNWS